MFITSRESAPIKCSPFHSWVLGLAKGLWRSSLFSSRGENFRSKRVITRLIPAGQVRTSGFFPLFPYVPGIKPVFRAGYIKILSHRLVKPQVMVVLMHTVHYFN